MTVAFRRMFGILEQWNNNQVTPSLSKPHELSYRSNIFQRLIDKIITPNLKQNVFCYLDDVIVVAKSILSVTQLMILR